MERAVWTDLLDCLRRTHGAHDALRAFCPFPGDIRAQPVARHPHPVEALMLADRTLNCGANPALRDAFLAAAPFAMWRETYKDTAIGEDFLSRFGCYCLIGGGGAFDSAQMWAWVVYMPPRLWYPWHHHPGEEIYLVLAGEAEFLRHGEPPEALGPGGTSEHASNLPHAMETHESGVMALVLWRNGFDTPPVLTGPDVTGGPSRSRRRWQVC